MNELGLLTISNLITKVVEFIYEQRDSKAENLIEKFARQELLTRITGVSLSLLILVDFSIHTAGVVESAFYAIYRGVTTEKPIDFSLSIKHLKCLKMFIITFPTASIIGLLYPDLKAFGMLESCSVGSIRGLLLSRDKNHYSQENFIEASSIREYMLSLSDKLEDADKEKMLETIDLIKQAEDLEKDFSKILIHNNFFCFYTRVLSTIIQDLIEMDSSLFKQIVFKEILARILSLGLSFAALVEFLCEMSFLLPLTAIVIDIFSTGKIFNGNLGEMFLFILCNIKEIFLSLPGVFAGSAIGFLSPATGCLISNKNSRFFDSVRTSSRTVKNSIIESAKKLEDGKSILLPIGLPYYFSFGSNHFTTLLITKEGKGFTVSLMNKGFDSDYVTTKLTGNQKGLVDDKIIANLTESSLSIEDLEVYIEGLVEGVCMSIYDMQKKVYEKKETDLKNNLPEVTEELCVTDIIRGFQYKFVENTTDVKTKLWKNNHGGLLKCKPQITGDCPKASLLAAMHYHSWKKNKSDSKPYKMFIHAIKKKALEEDGHLLDISLGSPLTKNKSSIAAAERLKKAAKKI